MSKKEQNKVHEDLNHPEMVDYHKMIQFVCGLTNDQVILSKIYTYANRMIMLQSTTP